MSGEIHKSSGSAVKSRETSEAHPDELSLAENDGQGKAHEAGAGMGDDSGRENPAAKTPAKLRPRYLARVLGPDIRRVSEAA